MVGHEVPGILSHLDEIADEVATVIATFDPSVLDNAAAVKAVERFRSLVNLVSCGEMLAAGAVAELRPLATTAGLA
jgi:hypothetical protein